MRLTLKRYPDGRLRPCWYGDYLAQGARRVVTLCEWAGAPPDSGSVAQRGDAQFEDSRQRALNLLQDLTQSHRSRADKEVLIQRIHSARYGTRVKVTHLADLESKWDQIPRRRKPGRLHRENGHRILRRFIAHMTHVEPGVRELGAVTEDHVRSFMDSEEQRGITPRTWNVILHVMKSVFRRFEPFSDAWINYLATVPTKEGESIHREPFSPDEIKAVLESAVHNSFIFPLIVTALCTAMRRGDICNLQWKHIDLDKGFITVKTAKTGETVDIPILPMLRDLLVRTYPSPAPEPEDHVFPDAAKVYASSREMLDRELKRVLAHAGFIDPADAERIRHQSKRQARLASLPPADTLRQGLKALAATKMTDQRRNRMGGILSRYLKGMTVAQIAKDMRSSKGIVSMRLNDLESITQTVIVRRLPLPKVIRGSTLAKTSGQTPRLKRGSLKGWHSFRTTWITLALSAGVPMELVRRVTGHASADIVLKHYFRPGREQFKTALQSAMPDFMLSDSTNKIERALGILSSSSASTWEKDRKLVMALLNHR